MKTSHGETPKQVKHIPQTPPDSCICFFCGFWLTGIGSKQVIHSLPPKRPPFGSVYEMLMKDANVASSKVERPNRILLG